MDDTSFISAANSDAVRFFEFALEHNRNPSKLYIFVENLADPYIYFYYINVITQGNINSDDIRFFRCTNKRGVLDFSKDKKISAGRIAFIVDRDLDDSELVKNHTSPQHKTEKTPSNSREVYITDEYSLESQISDCAVFLSEFRMSTSIKKSIRQADTSRYEEEISHYHSHVVSILTEFMAWYIHHKYRSASQIKDLQLPHSFAKDMRNTIKMNQKDRLEFRLNILEQLKLNSCKNTKKPASEDYSDLLESIKSNIYHYIPPKLLCECIIPFYQSIITRFKQDKNHIIAREIDKINYVSYLLIHTKPPESFKKYLLRNGCIT